MKKLNNEELEVYVGGRDENKNDRVQDILGAACSIVGWGYGSNQTWCETTI